MAWQVYLLRQSHGGVEPATDESETMRPAVASWFTGYEGRRWMDKLLGAGEALELGGQRYPDRFTAQAKFVLPKVRAGLPGNGGDDHRNADDDIFIGGYPDGHYDRAVLDAITPDEWLRVDFWDQG